MSNERVIVGGGPVGTWTAIELARRNPRLEITRYEKNAEYIRKHVLRLEYFSLLFYAKSGADKLRQQFLEDVTGHNLLGNFSRAAGGSVFVSTSHLEGALTRYASAMGINLVQDEITSAANLLERHPNCQTFIAADGAHSQLRKELLGADALRDIPLQHVVEVKYQAQGRVRPLDFLGAQYKTQKILKHMAFEYVGREREGVTPVTIRFFVSPELYEQLPKANFKAPLGLDDPAMPPELAQDIKTYMNVRAKIAGETPVEGSAKITKLILSMYAVSQFAVEHEGCNVHFAGDAALGVPYFRALNAGIIGGSAIAAITAKDRSLARQRKLHNAYGPLSVAWEFSAARGKNSALNAYNWWRGASTQVPWEANKWSESQKDSFSGNFQRAYRPGDEPMP